ncbi:MAG: single-stranded-DNA-specific exonuclease RecJ [Luminiphilus sp.]|nr:single-stranded-DNA-specific exonuclease RecJ [Luminiphilus sp.]
MVPELKQRAKPVTPALASSGLSPLMQRLYANRGVTTADEIDLALKGLLPPQQLRGVAEAAELLADAIEGEARVVIVGDFDADGATSSALAVSVLRQMGLKEVSYLVPNRFEYGYGLSPEIVALAAEREPDLIVTVDNGISSLAGVATAQGLGISVLITDHHLPGNELPGADVIVNPNQPGCPFPSKSLAGVGVMFYVLTALRAELRDREWFERCGMAMPNLGDALDLVALGTIADVVPLDRNNRILVAAGLARIRAGRARPGIDALLEVAGRSADELSSSDLGFSLGPRLNAAGRLEDMAIGIECLLAESAFEARPLAQQLDDLNRERRDIETNMQEEALTQLSALEVDDETLKFGLCVYNKTFHQGVVGIVAARLRERYHRPTIVFADAGDEELKGSGRSIPGVHIRDVLDHVATLHPDLIGKFGGHAMAAGLSLSRQNLDQFQEAFDSAVAVALGHVPPEPVVMTDGELALDELTLDSAEVIAAGGPWGQHFPEPVFEGCFALVGQRLLKDKHLKLSLEAGGSTFEAIAFNIDRELWPDEQVKRVRIAYQPDINTFRGERRLQLMVRNLWPET